MFSETTILACTDGSKYAASVYDHAVWAARRMDAFVHLLHVVDVRSESVPYVNLSGSIGMNARQALKEELVALDEARGRVANARASIILHEAKAHFERASFTRVELQALHGDFLQTLQEQEEGACLLVVGKRGQGANMKKLHLGAHLERVVVAAQRPVLVSSRAFKPIERMLIAYDGGPSARKAVDFAVSQPLLRGLDCILLQCGRPGSAMESDLQRAEDALRGAGFSVEARQVDGHADEVIAETVKSAKIDLLVMGAYGHSRIRRLVIGSTTTTMIRTCLVPVLMFR